MTEQYRNQTINIDTDFRFVDQTDVDTTLTVPAVVLGPDDRYVLCGNTGGTAGYRINMPVVSLVPGAVFVIKNASLVAAPNPITIACAEIGGVINTQTFDLVASPLGTALASLFSCILVPDPPGKPVAPAIVPAVSTNWSIIRLPAAP